MAAVPHAGGAGGWAGAQAEGALLPQAQRPPTGEAQARGLGPLEQGGGVEVGAWGSDFAKAAVGPGACGGSCWGRGAIFLLRLEGRSLGPLPASGCGQHGQEEAGAGAARVAAAARAAGAQHVLVASVLCREEEELHSGEGGAHAVRPGQWRGRGVTDVGARGARGASGGGQPVTRGDGQAPRASCLDASQLGGSCRRPSFPSAHQVFTPDQGA